MSNIDLIKNAARGKWPDVLSDVGGIPLSSLDGNHHPCPKCGGTDRFRLIDEMEGAVLCNQCFSTANGDGIAAVKWMNGWDYKETIDRLASHLGVTLESSKNGKRAHRAPDDSLKFIGPNVGLIFSWCRWKQGVSMESVIAAGGLVAKWRIFTVIALPMLNVSGQPTGWAMYNQSGENLQKTRDPRDGSEKILSTFASKSGWVGKHALENLSTAEVIWKVEGVSDMLALWTAIPSELRNTHLVLTNGCGANENPKTELLEIFRGRNVNVCMDTDRAGQIGKQKWAKALPGIAKEVRIVNLPQGEWKDIRDWLVAGHTYQELLKLAEATEPLQIAPQLDSPPGDPSQPAEPSSSAKETGTETGSDDDFPGEEADNDPSRLAIAFYRSKAKRITYRLEDFRYWELHYWPIKDLSVIRSNVTCFVRKELHRVNAEEVAASKNSEGPPPKVHKIGADLIASVIACLKAYCCVSPDISGNSEIEFPEDIGLITQGAPRHWISVENGIFMLDAYIRGGKELLREHTPNWFSFHKLPYPFDISAGAVQRPCWEEFLSRNLEGDQERIATLQEWAGYCLTPDTSLQRFLILEGEGANGKSVYCAVLEALLGPANVSHVPLELWAERFALTPTLDKLANIAAEVGELDKVAEGFLKSFVGGDTMTFDRKGKDPINAQPTARLVIATNNRPRFSDRSDGIWRRMLLIPFNVRIPEGDRVPGMDKPQWWLESGEMPAIFNWALEGLARLIERRRFEESTTTREAIAEYKIESNPAREFLIETYENEVGSEILSKEIYKDYRSWCEKNGFSPLNANHLGKEIRRQFVGCRRVQRGSKGVQERKYVGIKKIVDATGAEHF